MVTLFWGNASPLTQQLHRHRVFVFQQVGSKGEARMALDAGVDGLIVQGTESGGHVRGAQKLDLLLPEVVELTSTIPVFAAGGIYTSQDARRAIALGASGVCTGTRFLLTPESNAHEAYKQRLLAADQTIVTSLFGLGWPDLHRVVPNEATRKWGREDGTIPAWVHALYSAMAVTRKLVPFKKEAAAFQKPALPLFSPAALVSELPAELLEATALYAGEHVGRIRHIVPARIVVEELAMGMADAPGSR
jgi:NAD(P)H-dependent flavin oxidoreductase YrpB (nitropropane dioxygenase family)